MLNIFTNQKVRSRMESGPMGPYLSAIAAELLQQGYARSTIRRHLRDADHFGAWLVKQGLWLKDISEPIVDRYLKGLNRQFSSSCPGGRLLHKALGIPELVRFLRRQSALQTNVEQQQLSPTEGWLMDFDHHLDQVAGNAQRTPKLPSLCSAISHRDFRNRRAKLVWVASRADYRVRSESSI